MQDSKLSKVLKILIVPEIIFFLYVSLVWLLPHMLSAAVSFSGI